MSRVLRITDAASRRVSNPIFDDWTSGVPTNWTSTGTPTLAQIVSEGTVQSYASAYAVDILNGSTQAVRGIYQDITDLVEGQTYYVSVYVRPVVGTVRLYAWDGGGTSNAEFVESTSTTGEYQQLIVEKVATSGGIRIGLIAYDASSRAVFDLVQIATFNIEFIEGVYSTFFRVTNWDIAVPDYKGGGVFSSSPVAEGQKLIDGYWDNVSQTISFHLRGDTDQNAAANKLGELFQALQAARDFSKTSWVRDPVYMQFKAENETNYRYAFIANARIPQLSDMYSIDFKQLVMKDLDLIIEHPVAFGMPPGEGAPVLSGVRTTFDSQNYGNYDESGVAEDTAEWVYFGNRHVQANITNMHHGTGGANLIGGSLPRNIAQSSTITYFGIDSSLSSGTFFGFVFYISRVAVGGPTITWQYWNGSTWTNIPTDHDTSADFTKLGWQSVSFTVPSVATTSPGGSLPTGYWIRCNVSGSFSTVPQISRELFAITRNYVKFDTNTVEGSIAALTGFVARNVGNSDVDRLIGGLRSTDRGDEFQSIINLGGEENHSGITIAAGTTTLVTNTVNKATGYVSRSLTAAQHSMDIVIDNTLSDHYMGEFRCFLALSVANNATATAWIEYQQLKGLPFEVNEAFGITSFNSNVRVIDLGLISLSRDDNGGLDSNEITLRIYTTQSNTSALDRHALVLIPADEYQLDSYALDTSSEGVSTWGGLDRDNVIIGSIDYAKSMNRISFVLTPNGTKRAQMRYTTRANGPMILQNSQGQAFYFLMATRSTSEPTPFWLYTSEHSIAIRPKINPRYLGMRGSN